MKKTKKLVLYATGETAQIAYEYFTKDSAYRVTGFTIEKKIMTGKALHDLPVVPFEEVEKRFSPKTHDLFVAISYARLNRLRAKYYLAAKKKGYRLASYVSSAAFVWDTAAIGDNCMILEENVVQHGVKIGNNVILWSGNHIGHQTVIEDHVFISSHCVISGYCRIGKYAFLGVNSTYNDRIVIAPDTVVGSGAVIIQNTQKGKVYVGNPGKPLAKSSFEVFGIQATTI